MSRLRYLKTTKRPRKHKAVQEEVQEFLPANSPEQAAILAPSGHDNNNTSQVNISSNQSLNGNLEKTLEQIQIVLGANSDLQIHKFKGCAGLQDFAVVYFRSFVGHEELNKFILLPLISQSSSPRDMLEVAQSLPFAGTKESSIQFPDICQAIVSGDVVLLMSGSPSALRIPLKKYEMRAISEPQNEKIVSGPRDGFTEALWTNVGLLRERIKNTNLRVESITLGTRTSVELVVVYIEGLASQQIVDEIRSRIKRINVDRLESVGALNEFIADDPWTLFPTYLTTERPDRLSSGLLDGRVGIILDGTPGVMILPVVFWDFLKSQDDYIENFYFVSLIRIIRLISHFLTLFLSAAYIAVTTIHLEMLPQSLALIIAGTRGSTPLPTAFEILLMEIVVEILREAGMRMPGVFGQTLSIVGALVMGDAAVTAGLLEPIVVVVVALSTMASFAVPGYKAAVAIRLVRFPLIILSAFLGLYGLFLGAMFFLAILVSMRSVGVPYFAPVAPLMTSDMQDFFVRVPWWRLSHRPKFIRAVDKIRSGPNQKPGPEQES